MKKGGEKYAVNQVLQTCAQKDGSDHKKKWKKGGANNHFNNNGKVDDKVEGKERNNKIKKGSKAFNAIIVINVNILMMNVDQETTFKIKEMSMHLVQHKMTIQTQI